MTNRYLKHSGIKGGKDHLLVLIQDVYDHYWDLSGKIISSKLKKPEGLTHSDCKKDLEGLLDALDRLNFIVENHVRKRSSDKKTREAHSTFWKEHRERMKGVIQC